jgi:ATP-dependent exoDNAse (exonuclease V) alpha subunit
MGETFTGEPGVPRSERVSVSHHIEFNANQRRHFDHGYALTSHSSQGLTAERVLVHG